MNQTAKLRGWAVTRQRECTASPHELQWKLLSWMFDGTSSNQTKWTMTKSVVHNFSSVASIATQKAFDQQLPQVYQSPNLIATTINGRIVNDDVFEIGEAVIEEFMSIQVGHELGFNESMMDKLHYTPITTSGKLFLPMPMNITSCRIRNPSAEKRFRLSERINANASFSIDSIRDPMMYMFYFPKLGDPSTVPFLNMLRDELRFPISLELSVFPIVNLNRRDERKALFAFLNVRAEFSGREALQYLINGIIKGYQKAYQSYRINPSWEDIETLVFPGSEQFVTTAYFSEYLVQRNVSETTLLVNGRPFVGKEIHDHMREYWRHVNDEMHGFAKEGVLDGQTWMNLLENRSIRVDNMNCVSLIRNVNYLNLHQLPVTRQLEIIRVIESAKCVYSFGDDPVYVVVFGSGGVQDVIESRNWTIPFRVKYVYNPIFEGVKMLIGGICLDRVPDSSEFFALLEFAHHSFVQNTSNLTERQQIYWQLWKGSMERHQIKRMSHIPISQNYTLSLGSGELVCESVCDLFAEESRSVIAILDELLSFGVIRLQFQPSFPKNSPVKLPDHMKQEFIPAYAVTRDVSYDGSSFQFLFPSGWTVQRHGASWLVTAVTVVGMTDPYQNLAIGNETRVSQSDGLFVLFLPVGVYSCYGLSCHEVKVDSLFRVRLGRVPACDNCDLKQKLSTALNVLSFVTGKEYEDQLRVMMKTLTNYSKASVKFWIIGYAHTEMPVEYDITWLPLVMPGFAQRGSRIQRLRIAKLVNLELYFSSYVTSVLFCDPGTVWTGDASRFLRLNMKNASIAMPDISKRNKARADLFFMKPEILEERFHRPFHSTSVFFVNIRAWREQRGGDVIRGFYEKWRLRKFVMIDDELVNMAQGVIQVLTLPETVSFCDKFSSPSLAQNALSISLCSPGSAKLLPVPWEELTDEL